MNKRAYYLRLFTALLLFVTIFGPTSRPHLGLIPYLPFYAARAIVLAGPLTALSFIAAIAFDKRHKRFPDREVGLCLPLAAAILLLLSRKAPHLPSGWMPGAAFLAAIAGTWLAIDRRNRIAR